MAVNKYWMVYVAVAVPLMLSILSIVLVLTVKPAKRKPSATPPCTDSSECLNNGSCEDGKCKCNSQWTGDRCQVLALPPAPTSERNGKACGLTPVKCDSDESVCSTCTGTVPFVCTQVSASDNWAGLEGKYCLPVKPTEGCAADPGAGNYAERIPGVYMWQGWKDVETQKWTCACEYPDFYPAALDTGVCTKSPQLCKGGVWRYPCENGQCDLTVEQQQKLVGSPPLQYGKCDCENVPCDGDSKCVSGACVGGVCINQRLGLDPATGLPTCVVDTCAPKGKWIGTNQPPFTYGRCKCDPPAVDTGFACVSPEPPAPKPRCRDMCSLRGVCMPDGSCVCDDGWSGPTCADPVCPGGCEGRGQCTAPNTCTCSPQSTYNPTTQRCDPIIQCNPPPSVDPVTGAIQNRQNFPSADHTACVQGDAEQMAALCARSACTKQPECRAGGGDTWDTVERDLSKCFKGAECTSLPCTAEYCGDGVTEVIGDIYQEYTSDKRSCRNPSLDTVQQACESFQKGMNNPRLVYNADSSQYTCSFIRTQDNMTVKELTVYQGVGVTGSLCIQFPDESSKTTAMELDGNNVFVYYVIVTTADLVAPQKETDNEDIALAHGYLDLQFLEPSVAQPCTGYSYAFSAMFGDSALADLPVDTPLSIRFDAFPASRWTCKKGADMSNMLDACERAYTSGYIDVTMQPFQPGEGYSAKLTPQWNAAAALVISQDTGLWTKPDARTSVSSSVMSVVDASKLSPNSMFVNTTVPNIVQLACTKDYCTTGGTVTSSRLMMLAWGAMERVDNPLVLGGTCALTPGPLFVKYMLTRRESTGGGVTTLLSPTTQPHIVTVDMGKNKAKARVAYYLDAVPADQRKSFTYTLTAYTVTDPADTTTTYNTATCRSLENSVTVPVEPYSDEFCQQITAPQAGEGELPKFTWLDPATGMCFWENNHKPAIDYACALYEKTEFDPHDFKLADDFNVCQPLIPSYPAQVPGLQNWSGKFCNPSQPYTVDSFACVPHVPDIDFALQWSKATLESVNAGGVATVSPGNTLQLTVHAGTDEGFGVNVQHAPVQAFKYLIVDFELANLGEADDPQNRLVIFWNAANAQLKPLDGSLITSMTLTGADAMAPYQVVFEIVNVADKAAFGQDMVVMMGLATTARSTATVTVHQFGYSNTVPSSTFFKSCDRTSVGGQSLDACRATCRNAPTPNSLAASTPANCFAGVTANQYDTRVCRGWRSGSEERGEPQEARAVTCSEDIRFGSMKPDGMGQTGQGGLGSNANFVKRARDLYEFYKQHHVGADVKNVDYLSSRVDELWDMYYHCGPEVNKHYGEVNEACDPLDLACTALQNVDGCAGHNKCDEWVSLGAGKQGGVVYKQTRTCFPDDSLLGPNSQCCDCQGTYSFVDGKPQCACNPGAPDCNFALTQ